MTDFSSPLYPFVSRWHTPRPGLRMHYLDEGSGPVLLMLHGNPSWSWYYRNLVLGLRDRYRCIVPDHLGMGLSDKPGDADYRYTLQSRVEDLASLVDSLELTEPLTLVVHDWGGMIGAAWAFRDLSRIARVVVFNTAMFPMPASKRLPMGLWLGRNTGLGAALIRGLNAFAAGATRMAVKQRLSREIRRGYTAPYDSWAHRIATLRFVQDIPLAAGDPAWSLVADAGQRLGELADRPGFIAWGLRDFVFDHHFLEVFQGAWPEAEVHAFPNAGHYVLEDAGGEILPLLEAFLERTQSACR